MLKRFLPVAVALMFVLGLSGLALATTTARVYQASDQNISAIAQYSLNDNEAYVHQEGEYSDAEWNFSVIVQVSSVDNYANVKQYAEDWNRSLIMEIDVDCMLPGALYDFWTARELAEIWWLKYDHVVDDDDDVCDVCDWPDYWPY